MDKNNIFTVSAESSFLNALTSFILSQYHDVQKLASLLVLLPNNTLCNELQKILGRSLNILPDIKSMPGLDPAVLIFANFDFKPKISAMHRKMLLLDMMIQNMKLNSDFALSLIDRIEDLLDELQNQQIMNLPERYDGLWCDIIANYRAVLNQYGYCDIQEYYNKIIDGYATFWADNPPDFPVIIAGSTASMPARRNLLKTVVNLPNGTIILPNVDLYMNDAEWNAMNETHHQYNLKSFLDYIDVSRRDILCID